MATTGSSPNCLTLSRCFSRFSIPRASASELSLPESAAGTRPWNLRARSVATRTTAWGQMDAARHLMSRNFSAPRSKPNPASVNTTSARRRARSVATMLLQPWAMLPKGPPWTRAGAPSVVCTRFGRSASRSSAAMAPCGLEVAGIDGLAAPIEAQQDAPQPLLQVRVVAGQAQDGHHLAGRGDVEAVLARHAHGLAAEADDRAPQEAVVHVEGAAERHLPRVELAAVAAAGVRK